MSDTKNDEKRQEREKSHEQDLAQRLSEDRCYRRHERRYGWRSVCLQFLQLVCGLLRGFGLHRRHLHRHGKGHE